MSGNLKSSVMSPSAGSWEESHGLLNEQKISIYAGEKRGLGVAATTAFIVGCMAGGGILALPMATVQTGWIGLVLIAFLGIASAYTGVQLGQCWSLLLANWPEEYACQHIRHPYPTIGHRSVGAWGQNCVRISLDLSLFCSSAVFMLLVSENLSALFPGHLNYRIWIAIVAACLAPLCMLESPKDTPLVALLASGFTAVGTIIIFVLLLQLGPQEKIYQPPVSFETICFGVSVVAFSFGGHGTFPTFQHDMKDTSKFWIAVMISYVIIFIYYIPISAVGSQFFGNKVASNILMNLGQSTSAKVVRWMFTLHIFFAYLICANTLSQDLEILLHVPHRFGYKRVLVRGLQVVATLGIGQAVPCFDKILSLVGSSAVMLLSFICPPIFYVQLNKKLGNYIPLHAKVLSYEIAAVGTLALIACTYSSIKSLTEGCHYYRPDQ